MEEKEYELTPFNIEDFTLIEIHGIELNVDPAEYGWAEHKPETYHRLIGVVKYNNTILDSQIILHEDYLNSIMKNRELKINHITDNAIYVSLTENSGQQNINLSCNGIYAGDYELMNYESEADFEESDEENHTFYLLGMREY